MGKNYRSEADLTEDQFLEKYREYIDSGDLTEEYLRLRHRWMKGQATYQEVHAAFMKTNQSMKEKP